MRATVVYESRFGNTHEVAEAIAGALDAELISVDAPMRGVHDWLDDLPRGKGHAVTFDTRFEKPAFLTGSAAKGIAKRLRRKGFEVVATESFFVLGTDGPLKDGELERAAEWAEGLRNQVQDVERLPVGSH
jgi:flavodoxin